MKFVNLTGFDIILEMQDGSELALDSDGNRPQVANLHEVIDRQLGIDTVVMHRHVNGSLPDQQPGVALIVMPDLAVHLHHTTDRTDIYAADIDGYRQNRMVCSRLYCL